MEFNKRLYELRKQKGISQEELAEKLNVSRQTLSKWELGTSTPDMERLVAIHDYFEVSLDELVLGIKQEIPKVAVHIKDVEAKILTDQNKEKARKGLKIVGIVCAVIVGIDILSLIIALFVGFPK